MNVFNRVLMTVVILLAILIVVILAVAPLRSFDVLATFFRNVSTSVTTYQAAHWPIFATAQVILGGGLFILGIALLWAEFRSPRRKMIRAQKLAGGESHIAVDSITQRLAYNLDQLPDVVSAAPRVVGYSRGAVDLEVLLETAPEIDVPMKSGEVMQVTKEIVQDRMGLKLGKVQIKIKHAPYPKE